MMVEEAGEERRIWFEWIATQLDRMEGVRGKERNGRRSGRGEGGGREDLLEKRIYLDFSWRACIDVRGGGSGRISGRRNRIVNESKEEAREDKMGEGRRATENCK